MSFRTIMENVLNCVPSSNLKTFNDLGDAFKNPIDVQRLYGNSLIKVSKEQPILRA
jgi:hypothetical protein